jgi:membrane protein
MELVSLLKETVANFTRHKGQWMAAAIAYFTMLAIAPLIIVVVEIAGAFLGQHQAILDELYRYLAQSAGPSAEIGVRSIVTSTFNQHNAGVLAQIISWSIFVLAAIGLFTALQSALNTVWDVESNAQPILEAIRTRAVALVVVIFIALLLMVLLGVDAVLNTSSFFSAVSKIGQFVVSFVLTAVAFAVLFTFLPETHVERRSAWLGATVTALLFVGGQFVLGWYLGRAALSSTYGAFGGLVAFLIWVNYSAQIVLLGAEFTHVLATRASDASARRLPRLPDRRP